MTTTLVLHGHFYQPPRENPWTEEVPVEPSAAPFHDWNERITAECYRPNGWARIVDGHGRVLAIVNNYASLSFDVGPTLTSWLAEHHPPVLDRMVEADAQQRGAMAQPYNHMILPLADERDVRTQVRWGLADFDHRFGRPAVGMWLPEAAVNEDVLAVLVEEGVGFTILAPGQAEGPVDTRRTYRWVHSDGSGRGLDLVFYDGDLSHRVAFGMGELTSEGLVERARLAREGGGIVCVATDGETFGHHHRWADRAVAHALTVAAPRVGLTVTTAQEGLAAHPPEREVKVRESSWSCHHGVERWRSDCGCSTGGEPGWHQRWRGPLRSALDLVRDAAREVFERRGPAVLADHWAARDAYVNVLLDPSTIDEFAAVHVTGDLVEALTLLESQRHAMLMYTSCGWFFNDVAGLETVQVLRYAARAMDLLVELGEDPPLGAVLGELSSAESNRPEEGDGRQVWRRHVEPARVDAARVVAHVALTDLLELGPPAGVFGAFDVTIDERERVQRGSTVRCSGQVTVVHRRTRQSGQYGYTAVREGEAEPTVTVGDKAFDSRARLPDGETTTTTTTTLDAVQRAIADPAPDAVWGALAQLEPEDWQRAQEMVYDALVEAGHHPPPELVRLAEALHLAVDHLGAP